MQILTALCGRWWKRLMRRLRTHVINVSAVDLDSCKKGERLFFTIPIKPEVLVRKHDRIKIVFPGGHVIAQIPFPCRVVGVTGMRGLSDTGWRRQDDKR